MSNNISKIIRDARKQKSMTLKTLSAESGVSVGHLSEFENGKTDLGGEKLISVCRVLGVNIGAEPDEAYRVTAIHRKITLEEEQILRIFSDDPDAIEDLETLIALPKNKRKIYVGKMLEDLEKLKEDSE